MKSMRPVQAGSRAIPAAVRGAAIPEARAAQDTGPPSGTSASCRVDGDRRSGMRPGRSGESFTLPASVDSSAVAIVLPRVARKGLLRKIPRKVQLVVQHPSLTVASLPAQWLFCRRKMRQSQFLSAGAAPRLWLSPLLLLQDLLCCGPDGHLRQPQQSLCHSLPEKKGFHGEHTARPGVYTARFSNGTQAV